MKKATATKEFLETYPELVDTLNLNEGDEFEYEETNDRGDPIPKDPTKG